MKTEKQRISKMLAVAVLLIFGLSFYDQAIAESQIGLPRLPKFEANSSIVTSHSQTMVTEQAESLTKKLGQTRRAWPMALRSRPKDRSSAKVLQKKNFGWRGIKGWAWTPEQYLEEIPHLSKMKLNFLMNCYLSMFDTERYAWEKSNRWWEPLPPAKKLAFEKIVQRCKEYQIEFFFSMNPNLHSERFANPDLQQDVEALWAHYSWMQSLGVRWFNISLDDIGPRGSDPVMQAKLVNEIFRRLRKVDDDAQMIFCPTYYSGNGESGKDYLKTLGALLHQDVYVFWTGDTNIAQSITTNAAEAYRNTVGHKLFIWDNYPCNNGAATMHLGPLTGRDPGLCEVAEGYMSNSMAKQSRLNRLPLWTCAEYAYDPYNYNPSLSIKRAIANLATKSWQVDTLESLINAYPGRLVSKQDQLYNPVRGRLINDLRQGWSVRQVSWYPNWIEDLGHQLSSNFGNYYQEEYDLIMADVEWLRDKLSENIPKQQPF